VSRRTLLIRIVFWPSGNLWRVVCVRCSCSVSYEDKPLKEEEELKAAIASGVASLLEHECEGSE